jgi:hypothetical protein
LCFYILAKGKQNMNHLKTSILTAALAFASLASAKAQTALSAGDLAFIGIQVNGSTDNFSFVSFKDLSAGTVVYFTDNGWTGTGFRNSTASDFDGSEGLVFLKVKAGQTVGAGTILRALDTTNQVEWFSVSGSTAALNVPGTIGAGSTANPQFPFIALSQSGDQLYAFQSSLLEMNGSTSGSNPLFATSNQTQLAAINTATSWADSTSSTTGNITPGLTESDGSAIKINNAGSVLGTGAFFNTQFYTQATEAQWKAAIQNAANWTVTGSSDTGATVLPTGSLTIIPEPSSATLLGLGFLALLGVRRLARKS